MHKKTKDYKDAMTGGYCKFWDKLCDDCHLVCMVVTCPAAADHNVVAGKEFVLIKKTDERLKSWLWNCCRDTRMGPLVEMLTEKQHAASEAALKMVVVKGQKTRYRFRQECSVRRKVAKSRADELVTMMLPQADGSGGFQKVRVPLRLNPTCGWLPLEPEALLWLWQYAQIIEPPEKKRAVNPPIGPKITWHCGKGAYVDRRDAKYQRL